MIRRLETYVRIVEGVDGKDDERLMINVYQSVDNPNDTVYTVRLPVPARTNTGKLTLAESDIRIVGATSLNDAFDKVEETTKKHIENVENIVRQMALMTPATESENKLIVP